MIDALKKIPVIKFFYDTAPSWMMDNLPYPIAFLILIFYLPLLFAAPFLLFVWIMAIARGS